MFSRSGLGRAVSAARKFISIAAQADGWALDIEDLCRILLAANIMNTFLRFARAGRRASRMDEDSRARLFCFVSPAAGLVIPSTIGRITMSPFRG